MGVDGVVKVQMEEDVYEASKLKALRTVSVRWRHAQLAPIPRRHAEFGSDLCFFFKKNWPKFPDIFLPPEKMHRQLVSLL